MKPIVINSPSLANSDILELGKDLKTLVDCGCRYVHIDLMDGHYVPNLCFSLRTIPDIKKAYPDLTIDLHLMVDDPISYVDRVGETSGDYFSFHSDSTKFAIRTLEKIKKNNLKAGVVLNPSQPVSTIEPYVDLLDMVTLMAVEPGFAGQKFMVRTLPRILELAKLRKARNLQFLINVDGAINYENLVPAIRRGANVIVSGIFTIFQQPEGFPGAIDHFNREVQRAFNEGFFEDAY